MKFLKLFEEFTQEGNVIATVSGKQIKLEIPATDSEKNKGYMFSQGPQQDEGMLFVYPYESILTFWMKNVSVPLDILFFDSDRNLVDAQTMYPYKSEEDEKIYTSSKPARFALELPHGWIVRYLDWNNSKLTFQ